MHSVLLLIVSFGALAGLYILLDAPFTAVTQIIIYAGAIMVLFLFVVMLLNAHTEDEAGCHASRSAPHALQLRRAALGGARRSSWSGRCRGSAAPPFDATPAAAPAISTVRDDRHAALHRPTRSRSKSTSILILVAMVGAVVIARKPQRVSTDMVSLNSLPGRSRRSCSRSAPPACSCAAT